MTEFHRNRSSSPTLWLISHIHKPVSIKVMVLHLLTTAICLPHQNSLISGNTVLQISLVSFYKHLYSSFLGGKKNTILEHSSSSSGHIQTRADVASGRGSSCVMKGGSVNKGKIRKMTGCHQIQIPHLFTYCSSWSPEPQVSWHFCMWAPQFRAMGRSREES